MTGSNRARSALRPLGTLVPLLGLVTAVSLFCNLTASLDQDVAQDLILLVAVVGYYIFVGNSGVLSFGHVSFVALGVWTAGVLTVPAGEKSAITSRKASTIASKLL